MSATIAEIIEAAQLAIGDISGPGSQAYSEDRMFADVIRGFNLLFKKYPWDQYCKWFNVALDGTTGVITTEPFQAVLDFEDFLKVCRSNETRALPTLSSADNPYTMTGTQVRKWTSLHASDAKYAKRKLQFYPITATGNVNVRARVYPLIVPWAQTDIMYLDKDMLVYGTAYSTLAGDDINPGGAAIAKSMMEMRFRDIIAALASHPIEISANQGFPNDWRTAP